MQPWVVTCYYPLLCCCAAIPYPLLLCCAATLYCVSLCCYPLPSALLLRTISGKAPPCPAPVHCPLLLVLLRCRDLLAMFSFLYFFAFPHCVFSNVFSNVFKTLKRLSTETCFNILPGIFFLFEKDVQQIAKNAYFGEVVSANAYPGITLHVPPGHIFGFSIDPRSNVAQKNKKQYV